jgi:uncharacterized membrane protein (UPF0127 family)
VQMGWLLRDGEVLAGADLAESFWDRNRGLVGRATYDGALILTRTRAVHSFAMRFPLDVAFLDADLVVLATVRLPEWRMALPRRRGRSILESSAGSFDRWGLRLGDALEFRAAG